MSLNTVAPASLAEIASGLVCGSILDSIFPNNPIHENNGYMILIEAVIQAMVSTVVAGSTLVYLKRKGYFEESANNYGFFVSYIATQPRLLVKLGASMEYLKSRLLSYDGGMPTMMSSGAKAKPAPSESSIAQNIHGNPNPYTETIGNLTVL